MPTVQDPKLRDARKRGIMLEAMSSWILLMAGGDIAVMRHPEAIALVRGMISSLATG
jgi:acetyl-CoA decarbonylase/synthase complex subunit delta